MKPQILAISKLEWFQQTNKQLDKQLALKFTSINTLGRVYFSEKSNPDSYKMENFNKIALT